MKKFVKENLNVIVALSLSVLFILFIVLLAYYPFNTEVTEYDFVYATCEEYDCYKEIEEIVDINDGLIEVQNTDLLNENDIRFYIHNVSENKSTEFNFTELSEMYIDSKPLSPDNFRVEKGSTSGYSKTLLFSINTQSEFKYYLRKEGTSSGLNLQISQDSSYYDERFEFLGWVIP